MKRNQIENNRQPISEGLHSLHITSIEEPTELNKNFVTLKGTITDLEDKPINIYLHCISENNRPSIYDNTMLDIATQLNDTSDFDTDDIAGMSALFATKSVNIWSVKKTVDGKEYTNHYFNNNNNAVRAMLELQ